MKKSFIFGAALMLMGALSFQSCSQETNPGEPVTDPITADINAGADLVTLLEKYSVDGVLALPAGAELTIEEPVILEVPVAIVGDEKAPAKIIAKEGFTTNAGLILQNLKIDATELTKPLIQMGDTTGTGLLNKVIFAGVEEYSNINQNAWVLNNPIKIENCIIKDLPAQIFFANKYDWAVNEFTLNNNIIQLNNDNQKAFIDMEGSKCAIIKNLNITNNSIYNIKDVKDKFFIKGSNASNTQPKKIYGTTAADTYKWNISNNTMIKTFNKKAFANNTPSINTVTITLKNNIFVDVLQIQKFFGNCKKDIDKASNFIWGTEGFIIDNTDKNTYCTELGAAPFEVPAAALDLTAENGGLNLTPTGDAANAGDPRWTK